MNSACLLDVMHAKLKKSILLLPLLFIISGSALANEYVQTIRGTVQEKNLLSPLEGAVLYLDNDSLNTQRSGPDGSFEFREVPVGSHEIHCRMQGYKEVV